jgi:hypothetical protein
MPDGVANLKERPLGRLRGRYENDVKMEIGCGGRKYTELSKKN